MLNSNCGHINHAEQSLWML